MVNESLTIDRLPDGFTLSSGGLAELIGISPGNLSEKTRMGLLKPVARGRFLAVESVSAYCEHLRVGAGGRGKKSPERERLLAAQAETAELKLAKLRGELLDATEVEREWGGLLRQIRAGMLSLSSRLGARIPSLTRAEVEVIDDEVRQLLTLMGNANVDPAAKRREAIEELIG